jgi:hypothetical protein
MPSILVLILAVSPLDKVTKEEVMGQKGEAKGQKERPRD